MRNVSFEVIDLRSITARSSQRESKAEGVFKSLYLRLKVEASEGKDEFLWSELSEDVVLLFEKRGFLLTKQNGGVLINWSGEVPPTREIKVGDKFVEAEWVPDYTAYETADGILEVVKVGRTRVRLVKQYPGEDGSITARVNVEVHKAELLNTAIYISALELNLEENQG